MQEAQYLKKKEDNQELIAVYRRLLDLEESCWSTLFRFEKTQPFVNFDRRFSVPNILSIRLDDLIYLALLLVLVIIFGVLPLDGSYPMTSPYRQSLALFYLTSLIVTISPHWFRWVSLMFFCLLYPALIYLSFKGFISFMPVDTATAIYEYMGYLTLAGIFVLLLMIYPLKEYIRNTVGSLYSYIYGLSVSLIMYLWPFYSFIRQVGDSGQVTLNFITNNQPLIIAFITLLTTGFYFFAHHSLFEAQPEKVKKQLLEDLTEGELNRALQQAEEEEAVDPQESCIVRNFNVYVRTISFFIYVFTVASEIYLYIKFTQNTSMYIIGGVMAYILMFILLGAAFMMLPLSRELGIPILAVLSLSSALPSLAYYSPSVNQSYYFFISISFPFFALFWSLIKSISHKRPIFRTNAIFGLYLTVYFPFILIAINSFAIFTSDPTVIDSINFTLYALTALIFAVLIVFFIVREVLRRKGEAGDEDDSKKRVPVDYNYTEPGNPQYKPYTIQKQYSVGILGSVDLRQIGFIAGLVFFLLAELMAVHAINLITKKYTSTTFYSEVIDQVIYAQFFIILFFYIFSHIYLTNPPQVLFRGVFLTIFVVTIFACLTTGFLFSWKTTTLRIVGGFCVVMIFIMVGMEAIRSSAQRVFGFISSIVIITLWLFIIFPYAVIIPFASIFVDQNRFGTFVYICILASIILLITLVGVLSLVFNKLLDKYSEEKKYKFIMEDVITLFTEQGVQAEDQFVHILYESFLYRDRKYVFFLKRGFPVNLFQDPQDKITRLVTSEDYSLNRVPTKKRLGKQDAKSKSLLWNCLTFCCGADDDEIDEKMKKAKVVLENDELRALVPKNMLKGMIVKEEQEEQAIAPKKQWKDASKVYSSRSLVLKDLHSGARYLGDEFILLKSNKEPELAIQLWHNIFDFACNTDARQPLIISNDFKLLMKAAEVNLSDGEMDQIFTTYASKKWKEYMGMDLDNFSVAIEHIAEQYYPEKKGPERKHYLLINTIYYNLCLYDEFNNFMIEKKTRKRINRAEIRTSPFNDSFHKFSTLKKAEKTEQRAMVSRMKKHQKDKLLEPQRFNNEIFKEEKEEEEERGPSCKRLIYDKLVACQTCCEKEVGPDDFERKLFVRGWPVMCVDIVKIMERKEIEWDDAAEIRPTTMKCTLNNIIMGGFKLLDLYIYLSLTLLNPQIGWRTVSSSSNLYLGYEVQTFIGIGVMAISVPMGVRGVMLIFEDRLGLTENRLPATFPHPMFFFTIIYKGLTLSLFTLVTQTFLVTYNCNWTVDTAEPYSVYDDTSITCFSRTHNYFILVTLIGIIVYYPLSSYAMPNFQFAEKGLDLKYQPSYLILYFQVHFLLLSGRVLLSGVVNNKAVQLIYNIINIAALVVLALTVVCMKPCLVGWFNYIQLLVIVIGIIVNVVGLILYLTGEWAVCVIVACTLCALVLIFMLVFIRRRFFSMQVQSFEEEHADNVQELEMMWESKQKKDKQIISFQSRGRSLREDSKQHLFKEGMPEIIDVELDERTE